MLSGIFPIVYFYSAPGYLCLNFKVSFALKRNLLDHPSDQSLIEGTRYPGNPTQPLHYWASVMEGLWDGGASGMEGRWPSSLVFLSQGLQEEGLDLGTQIEAVRSLAQGNSKYQHKVDQISSDQQALQRSLEVRGQ